MSLLSSLISSAASSLTKSYLNSKKSSSSSSSSSKKSSSSSKKSSSSSKKSSSSSSNPYASKYGTGNSVDYYKDVWNKANAAGDTGAMNWAHNQADSIRGYQTNDDGTQRLTSASPTASNPYSGTNKAVTQTNTYNPNMSYQNSATAGSTNTSASATRPVTVKMPNGQIVAATVGADGKTYMQDGSRPPIGAEVNTGAGGIWRMTENGGVKLEQDKQVGTYSISNLSGQQQNPYADVQPEKVITTDNYGRTTDEMYQQKASYLAMRKRQIKQDADAQVQQLKAEMESRGLTNTDYAVTQINAVYANADQLYADEEAKIRSEVSSDVVKYLDSAMQENANWESAYQGREELGLDKAKYQSDNTGYMADGSMTLDAKAQEADYTGQYQTANGDTVDTLAQKQLALYERAQVMKEAIDIAGVLGYLPAQEAVKYGLEARDYTTVELQMFTANLQEQMRQADLDYSRAIKVANINASAKDNSSNQLNDLVNGLQLKELLGNLDRENKVNNLVSETGVSANSANQLIDLLPAEGDSDAIRDQKAVNAWKIIETTAKKAGEAGFENSTDLKAAQNTLKKYYPDKPEYFRYKSDDKYTQSVDKTISKYSGDGVSYEQALQKINDEYNNKLQKGENMISPVTGLPNPFVTFPYQGESLTKLNDEYDLYRYAVSQKYGK